MRLGADPAALESCAASTRRLTILLHRAGVRAASADRRWWRGRRAARFWSDLDVVLRRTHRLSGVLDALGVALGEQAEQQRRASLGPPQHSVLRSSLVGDGRWVSRTGSTHAELVVVLIPGVGSDVADRERLDAHALRVWEHLAGHVERSDRLGPGAAERVAVVSWLGYDPPNHLIGGLARAPAVLGAHQLVADLHGLRQEGAARIVLVGHSYGAVVAARASSSGAAPDELVVLGAPGLGVGARSELGLAPGGDLWAATARADPISLVARAGLVHGVDPAPVARGLPTSRTGHGSYLGDPALLAALARLSTAGLRSPA